MGEYNHVFHFNNSFFDEEKYFGSIRLLQIGDLQCQANSIIPEHVQCCFEITYAVSGRGMCVLNGKEIGLEKGEINIALKNDRHSIVSDPAMPLRYYFLAFDLLISHPLYNHLKLFQKKIINEQERNQKDRFHIEDVFVRCFAEFSNKNEFSDVLIESSINQIICYVFQNFYLQDYSYRPKYEKNEVFVYSIINYVEENILDIFSVEDVFRHFNYSASHISHIFSKYMNKTLFSFISDCKLERALKMISSGEHSITQVSEILGYSSIHSFSRAFKTKYKTSPHVFIKSKIDRIQPRKEFRTGAV
jgi:AraC-like DNA-binding protein